MALAVFFPLFLPPAFTDSSPALCDVGPNYEHQVRASSLGEVMIQLFFFFECPFFSSGANLVVALSDISLTTKSRRSEFFPENDSRR